MRWTTARALFYFLLPADAQHYGIFPVRKIANFGMTGTYNNPFKMFIPLLTACKWLSWWKTGIFIVYNFQFKRYLGYFLSDICISYGQCPCVHGENNSLSTAIKLTWRLPKTTYGYLVNNLLGRSCSSHFPRQRNQSSCWSLPRWCKIYSWGIFFKKLAKIRGGQLHLPSEKASGRRWCR